MKLVIVFNMNMWIDDYGTNDAYMLDKGMFSSSTLRQGTNVYTQLIVFVPINNTIHYRSKLIYVAKYTSVCEQRLSSLTSSACAALALALADLAALSMAHWVHQRPIHGPSSSQP